MTLHASDDAGSASSQIFAESTLNGIKNAQSNYYMQKQGQNQQQKRIH